MHENPINRIEAEKPSRNLLTQREATLAAMAEIEGEVWAEQQQEGEHTVQGALHYLDYLKQELPFIPDDEEGNQIIYHIYGVGGFNRWFVRHDGSVEFSSQNAIPEVIERARRLGFKIF